MLKYLPVLLLFIFACKVDRLPVVSDTLPKEETNRAPFIQSKVKPHTVTLLAESSPNDNITAFYYNEFQDQKRLFFERDSLTSKYKPLIIPTKYGLWLRFTKGMAQYPVYVHPGDTLLIKSYLRGGVNYVFSVKEPGDINFYTLYNQKSSGFGFPNIVGERMTLPKLQGRTRMVNDQYRERMQFINRVKDSLNLTPRFQHYITNQVTSIYLTGLLSPYNAKNFSLTLPQTYLDTLASFKQTYFFKQDSLVFSSEHYQRAINHYNRYLSRNALNTIHENEVQYQNAKEHFSGQVRNFVLFAFLKEKIQQDINMESYLARFRKDCTYAPYVQYLDSLNRRPVALISDKELLSNSLVTEADQTITWENIIQKNKGKVIYVDLWASWCAPCLIEMPASAQLHDKLKGQPIVFVNISIDFAKDAHKWKQAISKYGLKRPDTQNYRMEYNSPLAVYIHGRPGGVSIPHYVIIDKTGQVAAIEAKRPTNPQLFNDLTQLLKK